MSGLIVRDDPKQVGHYIAHYISNRSVACLLYVDYLLTFCISINEFAPTADRPFVLGLPTGSSPIPTYKALIQLVKEGKLS